MEWGVPSIADLQRMKEKMDRELDKTLEEDPIAKEGETGQWVEKLPKFEGTGRRNLRTRKKI
jgi:hypothetical protein